MLKIKIKPITNWNGEETDEPRRSQFRQTYRDTLKLLEKELSYLDIRTDSLAIEMFVHPNQIRTDGQLRADARAYQQGVKLSFDLITWSEAIPGTNQRKIQFQPVSYPCDRFDDWQDNLRAIALSLEALRRVERYGVLKFQEVVARLALPSADGKLSSRDDALSFLAEHSDLTVSIISRSKEALKLAYRTAAQKFHPDKTGGKTSQEFLILQEYKKVLGI